MSDKYLFHRPLAEWYAKLQNEFRVAADKRRLPDVKSRRENQLIKVVALGFAGQCLPKSLLKSLRRRFNINVAGIVEVKLEVLDIE